MSLFSVWTHKYLYLIPECWTILRELHDPIILDIATSVQIDKLESGAPPDQLVEGLVTDVDTALNM